MRTILIFLLSAFGPTFAQTPRDMKLDARPPRGAEILFNGRDTSGWVHRNGRTPIQWLVKDGYLECKPGSGDIMSLRQFGDCRLHVEFNLPLMPEATSQGRANSGVYLQSRYEIQVLDSFRNPTYPRGGVGAIYGQKDPDRDAVRPPGVWQAYDILFKAARLDSGGRIQQRPRITVYHNGILIHDNVEIAETETLRNIGGQVMPRGPVLLQDHGNRVRYRNIWVVSEQAPGATDPRPARRDSRGSIWD